jgi:CheY-like chemotaxis protein/Tfp pilus assembly protein PilZ
MHTLLLVDDVKTTLAVEKAFLEARAFKVFATSSVEEALALAGVIKADLIILDYEMPGMTGEEVCRRLKADEVTAGTPIMILSAHEDETTALACERAGATKFVRKSEGREGLLAHVSEILGLPLRRHPRIGCSIPVSLPRDGRLAQGLIHNLSQGGLYLTTEEHFKVGEPIKLQFTLPTTGRQVQVFGEVMRIEELTEKRSGLGVQFLEASEEDINALEAWAGTA